MKVDKLTQEQRARFADFVHEWTAIGLSTEPANRPEAELGIREAYEAAGLNSPARIVWGQSPFALAVARGIVRASVRDSVGDSVRASVWDSVRASVRASVGDSVWASVRAACYGQHDANWLAFYDYFAQVLDLKTETQKLVGLWRIARSANWFWAHEHICWISERHNILNRDVDGRLHCENGVALAYPDGWSIYAIHGVRVNEQIVMRPDTLAVEQIESADNAEVRRVMIERMGQERFIVESGLQPVHSDEYGELYRKELSGDEPLVMVKVLNSTPERDGSHKSYFIRVSPQCRTAHEAVAWTFDMKPSEYQPRFES